MSDNPNSHQHLYYNFNPLDYNSWFYFERPYVNVFPFNIVPTDVAYYPENDYYFDKNDNFLQDNCFSNVLMDNRQNDYHQKNDKLMVSNEIENLSEFKNSYSVRKSQQHKSNNIDRNQRISTNYETNKIYKDDRGALFKSSPLISNTDRGKQSRNVDVLNRNSKSDQEKFRKHFILSKDEDFDKDFPPISNSKTSGVVPTAKPCSTMDFKLVLQKPPTKPAVIQQPKSNHPSTSDKTAEAENNEIIGTVKKKRKRKRKKPKPEPVEEFAFIENDFPTLTEMKQEQQQQRQSSVAVTDMKSVSIGEQTKDLPKLDRRNKRRQLLYILPGDLEGQVRIVPSSFVEKKKNKRKTNSDRLKRPIGLLNPLDLNAPTVKRGKERLKPKQKKPTKLKKVILMYRKNKKELKKIETEINPEEDKKRESVVDQYPVLKSSLNKIHSRQFREYCNHMINNNINIIITDLLKTLLGFQDRLHHKDPAKAKMKRRLCFGLREVTKYVKIKRLRLIIIAPDLEKVDIDGGLDDIVNNVIKSSQESGIPCVFALTRNGLAHICYKKYRVGAIGVFNYDGAENHVKKLLEAVEEAKDQYNQIKLIAESINADMPLNPTENVPFSDNFESKYKTNVTLCHSRTPSNALSEPISDFGDVNKLPFDSISEDQIKAEEASQLKSDEFEEKLITDYIQDVLLAVSKMSLNC